MKTFLKEYRLVLGLSSIGLVGVLLAYLSSRGLIVDIAMLQMYLEDITLFFEQNRVFGAFLFASIYILAVGLSLPIATPLTLLAGFLFGSLWGTVFVAFSATTGATVIFLLVRFFFGEFVSGKFGPRLTRLNRELAKGGFKDIFVLRLIPLVPFSLINLGAGLTKVRTRDYVLATFFGTIPFTFVYVNAGTQLAKITGGEEVVSFQVLLGISLIILAFVLPRFTRHLRSAD